MVVERSRWNSKVLGVCLLSCIALPAFAAGQSYGLGDQTTTVQASAFHPSTSGSNPFHYTEGYLYGAGTAIAPVSLPDGAIVTTVCVYANDPDDASEVQVALWDVGMAAGGQTPTYNEWDFLDADFDIGFGVVCNDVGYVFQDLNLGSGLNTTHEIGVSITGNAGLAGVKLTWHRSVSPAPGVPTFNDVPADDGGFQYVEALVASGITAGCGGGNFCPDSPLTRRQMAVFLAKALGLHHPF
jgi:hypothetical protein